MEFNWIILVYIAMPALLLYMNVKSAGKGGSPLYTYPLLTKKMSLILNGTMLVMFLLIIVYWAAMLRTGQEIVTGIVTITGAIVLVIVLLRTNKIVFKESGVLIRSWFIPYQEITEFRQTKIDDTYDNLQLKVASKNRPMVMNYRVPREDHEAIKVLLKENMKTKKKKKK